ncbi:MAG: tRNA (adenosine(37)-N6)-threonylcarbamoyltransferase complex dimerization subunit type 1 TsaB [Solirubrobacteraceae bacterium]
MILGLDTATPATVAGICGDGVTPAERRHVPAPGERPGHVRELLPLARAVLAEAGADLAAVERIAVGVGPGTFTGLRIGIATARALAQASGAALAGVSTLRALAAAAAHDGPVLAVLDARRGEAFAAAWEGDRELLAPVAVAPEALAGLCGAGPWLAVGDGAIKFRQHLGDAAEVPDDDDPRHAVSALAVCRLGAVAPAVDRDALVPDYVRAPDAVPRPR